MIVLNDPHYPGQGYIPSAEEDFQGFSTLTCISILKEKKR